MKVTLESKSRYEVGLVSILEKTENDDAQMICHIRSELDISRARLLILRLIETTNTLNLNRTRLATAVTEIAWNALRHGGGGVMCAWLTRTKDIYEMKVKVADEGCGIIDIPWAFNEKNTTGGTLGLGLSGTARLVDHIDVISPIPCLGYGTLVTLEVRWTS